MNTTNIAKKKIEYVLTGSRIDDMPILYGIIKELFVKNDYPPRLDFTYVFNEVMKRSKGRFDPNFVMEELKKI